jgi:hypothetical protein
MHGKLVYFISPPHHHSMDEINDKGHVPKCAYDAPSSDHHRLSNLQDFVAAKILPFAFVEGEGCPRFRLVQSGESSAVSTCSLGLPSLGLPRYRAKDSVISVTPKEHYCETTTALKEIC